MKKLLIILTAIVLCLTFFAGCGKDSKTDDGSTTAVDTTTVAKNSDSVIEPGRLRGDTYVNKSLGFRVYVPSGYNRQDFGDIVLTPDSTDVPTYEYYIAKDTDGKSKKRKAMYITVEDTKLTSTSDWVKKNSKSDENKSCKTEKSKVIGEKEFEAVSVKDIKNKKNKVIFAFVDKGRIAKITFENFSYNDAIEFISDNFEA